MPSDSVLKLYYWPTIQGRGEFVRLILEDSATPYIDVARIDGVDALMELLRSAQQRPVLAPPIVVDGTQHIGQTVQILQHLAPRCGLNPRKVIDRTFAGQLELTLADFLVEVHDTHHPIASSLTYEEQSDEAQRRAAIFVAERIPKFLGYFERVLSANRSRGPWLVGARACTADLSLFQIVSGLRYAFPQAMARLEGQYGRVIRLHNAVAARPGIAAYLQSERRIAFNNNGIFRHYPELDG